MIINVTEQQKRLIESQGYMVVEFKAWAKRLSECLQELADRFVDIWEQIYCFLQEKICRVLDSWKLFIDEACEDIDLFASVEECLNYELNRKYSFVRSLGRTYRLNFSNRVIYHRCRDRC